MADKFDFIRRLGSGHFGEVWLVHETGLDIRVALKIIPPHKFINVNNIFHEAQILQLSQHDNVVKVLDTGKINNGSVYISMEYLERGSLEDEAKGSYVDLSRAKRLICDVLRGLSHLHKNAVLHRDIKPANILVGKKMKENYRILAWQCLPA